MINIKKAGLEDLQLLTELGKTTFWQSHGNSASEKDIAYYVENSLSEEMFEKELLNPENNYYIMYYNTKAAGFSNCVFNSTDISIEEKNVTRLGRIYLLKEFLGLKLGKTLFEFNTELSKQKGQKGMWLYVWTGNATALSFYTKAGFKIMRNAVFKISEEHSNPNYIMYLAY